MTVIAKLLHNANCVFYCELLILSSVLQPNDNLLACEYVDMLIEPGYPCISTKEL